MFQEPTSFLTPNPSSITLDLTPTLTVDINLTLNDISGGSNLEKNYMNIGLPVLPMYIGALL